MVQVTHYPQDEESNTSEKTTRRSSENACQSIAFRDLESASNGLKKAVEANDPVLGRKCIEFFDLLLGNKENLIPVLKCLSEIMPPKDLSNCHSPSAPPMNGCASHNWVQELTEKLRENILLEIDKHAEYILKKKEFLDVCFVDLKTILTRDTLRLSNEILVYDAIKRRVEKEKKNKNAGSCCTWDNLIRAPRYGCMSMVDFSREPKSNPSLNLEERLCIEQYILNRGAGKNPQPLPHKGSQPRLYTNERPHKLSSRSYSRESSPSSTCSKKSTKDKVIINLLSCFTAVFD
ncbi:unnamed protein product [Brassicogethes aeneus]|uniref:BACK domain-containing protein n=1 Tax=Brassicogethes aeneus TaxID=1431903 RepID=A0A9P0AV89_BRAAE|nr:unnamed protein product [Brassicogethes aeneus]